MNKFLKLLLVGLAIVIGILLCALIGINLYLQSSTVQNKILKSVEESLGMKLTLGGTSYTPWGGLKLADVSLAEPETPQHPFAKVASINFDISPWLLLQKKIHITSVTLDKPVVELKQGQSIRIPSPRQKADNQSSKREGSFNEAPNSPSLSMTEASNLSAEEPSPASEDNYEIEVKKIRIKSGLITIVDEASHPVITCKNVNTTAAIEDEWALKGEASADEIAWGERLFVRPINLHYHRNAGHIIVDQIEGKLAEGKVTGAIDIDESTNHFDKNLQFTAISIPKLLEEAGFAESKAAGTIEGLLSLHGKINDKASYMGEGKIHLLNATLEPFNFLKKLGQLLQIDELQLLNLRQANAHFLVGQSKIFLDKVFLQSENLIIESTGTIDFNGNLDLNASLLINEKLQRNLGSLLGKNFIDSDQEGYKQMKFEVSGNIKKPKTDLLEKLTGFRLGNSLGSLLQNFISVPPKTASE